MSRVGRAVAVAVVVCTGGVAACGDDADPVAADAPSTTARERGLSVCGVEEEVDRIALGASPAGDFAAQRQNALTYLDEILAVRARGRPPADIAADYASVTKAYEVVRAGFAAAATPEEYLGEVEGGAVAAFGTPDGGRPVPGRLHRLGPAAVRVRPRAGHQPLRRGLIRRRLPREMKGSGPNGSTVVCDPSH